MLRGLKMDEILKIAICEDEVRALNIIGEAINSTFKYYQINTEISKFSTFASFYNNHLRKHFNLLFLDIDLGNEDGIEEALKLRKEDKEIDIIYVSNNNSKVFDSLATMPFEFVRKSNILDDLNTSIELYVKNKLTKEKEDALTITDSSEISCIKLADIIYISSDGKEQIIHLLNGHTQSIKKKMDDFEKELINKNFVRIHKSTIINVKYVKSIGLDRVELKNGDVLTISRRRKSDLKEAFFKYQFDADNPIV